MTLFKPFPKSLAGIIADYCAELRLREWIQPEAVYANPNIWKNPNAVLAGVLDLTQIEHHAEEAAANPALIDLIKEKFDDYVNTYAIWQNPAALELLIDFYGGDDSYEEMIEWDYLSSNSHPRAIKLLIKQLEDDPEYLDLAEFLANPGAATYIKANREFLIDLNDEQDVWHYYALGNPAAIDDVRDTYKSSIWNSNGFKPMSKNPHPWAIEQLRLRWSEVDMDSFAANPGIFHYVTSKKLVKLLSR